MLAGELEKISFLQLKCTEVSSNYMESSDRMDRNWRGQSREVLANSGVSTRGKERIRRFEHFDDEYTFGDRLKLETFQSRDHYGMKNSGPSNHLHHGHEREMRSNHGYDDHPRFEELETDRAELIRKLDELKFKLTRSCDLTDKSQERFVGNNNQRMMLSSPVRPNHSSVVNHSMYAQEGYCCTHVNELVPSLSPCHRCALRYSYPQEQHFRALLGHSGPGFRGSSPHQSPYSHSPYDHESVSYQQHASCPCVHCCNNHPNNHRLPEKVHPANKSELHSRESLGSGDLNSYRPKKYTVAKKRVRVWFPMAGGAPVVTCSNCFELLKLPKKLHASAAKVAQKMKCGACSSVILFDMGSGGQASSAFQRIRKVVVEANYQDLTGKEDEDKIPLQGNSNNGSDTTNTCYEDCDAVADSPKEESSKSEDDEKDPEKLPIVDAESSVRPNSVSCQASENYSDSVGEDKAQRTEVEEAFSHESLQSSLKETETIATEMDVSINELPNSSISQESEETSKDDHSRESTEIAEVFRSRVYVNGHLIPIHEVEKAEKLAGPIQPGNYWYDSIAGSWGVMGHPCQGIIMPNIGPFDYPMPSNCGAGNTSVYVNGRELYDKDLDLLVRRGLPNMRNRSYIIDMSGKVIDGQTGQELDSLGKLAPTVENAMHGFGMKVPKYIARRLS